MAHLNESLDKLSQSLAKEGLDAFGPIKDYIRQEHDGDEEKLKLLLRKGVFPFSYVDSNEKLNEPLPPRERFYNDLTDTECSIADYEHVQKVWATFEMKTLRDLCDVYVKSDVLLLTSIMDRYREECLSTYSLDPIHYFSAPGMIQFN